VATFENTVIIRRPTAEVFAFLADFENVPRWNYAIVETHKVSQGPVGVGTVYQQVRSVPSRSEEGFEGHRLQPTPAAGDPRPARAVPLAPLLCPGRRSRGNPGHELGGA
jgi:Polyketide cyclase / dehydrase and lipid transport